MTDRAPTPISTADVKRHFADVLGAVKHRGERYVIERNGTPMAALVPLRDLAGASQYQAPTGALALVGRFDDAPEFGDALLAVVKSRRGQRGRKAPQLTE